MFVLISISKFSSAVVVKCLHSDEELVCLNLANTKLGFVLTPLISEKLSLFLLGNLRRNICDKVDN